MKHKIGFASATALVISAMVGTGVYTSLGFQVMGIQSIWAIMILWLVGGLVALCGSLVYGELGSVLKGSGGEYNYLSRIYHPAVGCMSGFVSATIGFAAPVALSSMAFGKYVCTFFPNIPSEWLATVLIVCVTLLQLQGIRSGSVFQRFSTVVNVVLILLFVSIGLLLGPHTEVDLSFGTKDISQVFSSAFAISLVYVSYSYSGWNSSAYIAGEIDQPEKNLPLSLSCGAAVVAFLYISLNFSFLYNVPIPELAGKVEVGQVAATSLFGIQGSVIVSALIALGLMASVNAMSMVGPRVTRSVAYDFPIFRFFTIENKKGNPYMAQLLLAGIALLLVHTSTFQDVLTFIGFTLSLFTCLTVAGIFVLRSKFPPSTHFRTWGFPVTPLFFLVTELFMLVYIFIESPWQSIAGLTVAGTGSIIYFLSPKTNTTV